MNFAFGRNTDIVNDHSTMIIIIGTCDAKQKSHSIQLVPMIKL